MGAWSRAGGILLLASGAIACDGSNNGNGGEGQLTDITEASGLRFVHEFGALGSYYYPEILSAGGAFLDYDNDGDLDVYVINGARRTGEVQSAPFRNRLFRQEPGGTFVDVTESSGLGDTGFGMGAAVGDIDNDGDVDVYVTNVGPDALYRNDGEGTFTDVTSAAGIRNASWAASAAFTDVDRDGYLDVYVTNYVALDTSVVCTDLSGRRDYCGPNYYAGVSDVLYRNNGDGSFRDITVESGIASVSSTGLGVVSADFNGDAHPDIYVANDGAANQLWINRGDGTFRDKAIELGAAVSGLGHAEAGMGIGLGDTDNDADLDLFVTHWRGEANRLYQRGAYAFEDHSLRARLAGRSVHYTGFGTGFADYDHDGDLDLFVVNGRVLGGPVLSESTTDYWAVYAEPNMVFANDGDGRFRDVSNREPGFSRHIENSRGLAFGDVDNDGDLDFLVTNGGGTARLIRNDVGGQGHWLMVRAVDPALKRYAIGAHVTVIADGQERHRMVTRAYSYLSSNDPRVHFGLGGATSVSAIAVRWHDGTTERFPGVAADQMVTLEKGAGSAHD